ncbi:MAG TPA: 3-hydroxyacyl-CoA dehydrogenase family protein [Solirubrobacteraceae bacterium]|nr:3-hydroxyacyl-CoA dehydrogenase family protein [Solirubrobacteraceae bacterium]
MQERLGIAGGGAIACGLAGVAAGHTDVVMLVRSPAGAQRASERLADTTRVRIEVEPEALAGCSFVVEAIAEDERSKALLLTALHGVLAEDAILATTTSSLSVARLAQASGRPERFVGLHVFNPVDKMDLVELALPPQARDSTRERARALCELLEKTAIEVPDRPGFVVNALLFPYLFGAARLVEQTGMTAHDVDACMTLGAGHRMGPLAVLDLVGLDVAAAIGGAIGEPVPDSVRERVASGALGRKSGRGFHTYENC